MMVDTPGIKYAQIQNDRITETRETSYKHLKYVLKTMIFQLFLLIKNRIIQKIHQFIGKFLFS